MDATTTTTATRAGKAQTRLDFEVEAAVMEFARARKAWMGDVTNLDAERANHTAYELLWAACRNNQNKVIEALKFIGVYRDK